jgi:hypothetical protein
MKHTTQNTARAAEGTLARQFARVLSILAASPVGSPIFAAAVRRYHELRAAQRAQSAALAEALR